MGIQNTLYLLRSICAFGSLSFLIQEKEREAKGATNRTERAWELL